jgi:hypothetical protein
MRNPAPSRQKRGAVANTTTAPAKYDAPRGGISASETGRHINIAANATAVIVGREPFTQLTKSMPSR